MTELRFILPSSSELARRLPKNVRLVSPSAVAGGERLAPTGLVEFEVVVGNAAYREGEHFFLTAGQARQAYRLPA